MQQNRLVSEKADYLSRQTKTWLLAHAPGPTSVLWGLVVLLVRWVQMQKWANFYAATGLAQLKRWDQIIDRRTEVLSAYQTRLKPLDNALVWQQADEGFVPATLVVRTQGKAKAIAEHLKNEGIHTRFWYLPPLYEHPALVQFAKGQAPASDFPVTEALKHDLIGLPFHPSCQLMMSPPYVRRLKKVYSSMGRRKGRQMPPKVKPASASSKTLAQKTAEPAKVNAQATGAATKKIDIPEKFSEQVSLFDRLVYSKDYRAAYELLQKMLQKLEGGEGLFWRHSCRDHTSGGTASHDFLRCCLPTFL